MAMGFNTLSMVWSNILRVREVQIAMSQWQIKQLLDNVLQMNNPLVIKSWLEHYLKTRWLGRYGKIRICLVSAQGDN